MKEPVEVINRHTEEYVEVFDDETIRIPAGGRVVMNRRQAVRFLGIHPGMDAKKGTMKIKNLDIIPLAKGAVEAAPKFICNVDGLEFSTQKELDEHTRLVHGGQQYKDERLEKKAEEKEVGIACPLCGFIAKNKAGLRVHLANCKADVPATE